MVINKIPFIGNGVIKPYIPEQNIDFETYVVDEVAYVYIKGLNLDGLSGEYTIPQYIDGKEVKKIGFNVNTNLGAVSHIIIPFPFIARFSKENDGFVPNQSVFHVSPAKMTINAITGFEKQSGNGMDWYLFKQGIQILNVVSSISSKIENSDYFHAAGDLKIFNLKKINSLNSPTGYFTNLIIKDEYCLAGFSYINCRLKDVRVDTLRLTNAISINADSALRSIGVTTLYLDNYIGDTSRDYRFADNSNLTVIYAPILATVSNTDFANCPNIAHIYTDASNVQTLKNELSNKGYSGLVDLVEAI